MSEIEAIYFDCITLWIDVTFRQYGSYNEQDAMSRTARISRCLKAIHEFPEGSRF
jgi:adenosyl cobinamide kinase/adenosyl cobinamide phosphate guanylyltransferase